MRLLDPGFRYVPSANTNVAATWRRFGFRPTTEAERLARQARNGELRAGKVLADPAARPERRRPLSAPGESRPGHLRLAVSE